MYYAYVPHIVRIVHGWYLLHQILQDDSFSHSSWFMKLLSNSAFQKLESIISIVHDSEPQAAGWPHIQNSAKKSELFLFSTSHTPSPLVQPSGQGWGTLQFGGEEAAPSAPALCPSGFASWVSRTTWTQETHCLTASAFISAVATCIVQ